MKLNKTLENSGMTLIELIVVIAIMSLVMIGAFSLFGFGQRIFNFGSDQYDLQSEIRLTTSQIRDVLQYATEVDILDTYSSTDFLDINDSNYGSQYMFLEKNGSGDGIAVTQYMFDPVSYTYTIKQLMTIPDSNTTFDMEFQKLGKNVIGLNISGDMNGQEYTLESSVEILNAQSDITANVGKAIRFEFFTEDTSVNKAPFAYPATLTGIAKEGEKLTGGYDYVDVESDIEGTSIYRWYRSTNNDITSYTDSNLTEIAGATSIEYVLTNSDVGYYIYFVVRPIATTGQLLGIWETSKPTSTTVVDSGTDTPPAATLVKIDGVVKKNLTVTGSYFYYDAEEDPEGVSLYKWYLSPAIDGVKTAIIGATNKTFEVKPWDEEKYLFFEVTPVSSTDGSHGDTVVSPGVFIPK